MPSGKLKWFNAAKGFGFIEPDEGGPDVFVHASALEAAGLNDLPEGQPVTYELRADRKTGKSSAADLQLRGGMVSPSPSRGPGGGAGPRGPRPDARPRPPRSESFSGGASGGLPGTGKVKWFNSTKGFGFISPDEGGDDLFVHISAVEQAGLHGLQEGQAIGFEVEADRRTGKRTAGRLRLLGGGGSSESSGGFGASRGPRTFGR